MRTDVAFDKLCDTLPIIKNIVDKAKADPAILAQLKAASEAKNKLDYFVVIPPILKSCKDEVFAMLAVWNDKSVEEVAEQPISTTIKQVMDIFVNKDVMDFLSSAQESAQENTDTDEPLTSSEIMQEVSQQEVQTENATYEAFAHTFPIE